MLNRLKAQPELANLLLFAPELPDLLRKAYSDTCHARRKPNGNEFDVLAALQTVRGVLSNIHGNSRYDKNQIVIDALAATSLVLKGLNGYVLTALGILCISETPSIGGVNK